MDKVYFVGNQIGAVDILMYYLLYNSVVSITYYNCNVVYFFKNKLKYAIQI